MSKTSNDRIGDSPQDGVEGMRDASLVRRKVRAAKRAIAAETLWPRVWLPVSVAGVFVLLSALGVWEWLPPRVHVTLLWGFGGAFVLSIVPLAVWHWPADTEALGRLEASSGLDHRPLTAFKDTLPSGTAPSPETQALWEAHRARMAALLEKLKAGAIRPRVDRHDPFALRAALLLLLAVAVFWQWTELRPRIAMAFEVDRRAGEPLYRLDVWITPPSYTRKDATVLANGTPSTAERATPIEVPTGSSVTIKINGAAAREYEADLHGSGGMPAPLGVTPNSKDTYAEFAGKITSSGTLSIRHRHETLASWPLTIIPDKPPVIAFNGRVEAGQRGAILLKYKVEDDYGVVAAEARVERIATGSTGAQDGQAETQIGVPPVFALTVPRAPAKSGDAKTYKDLTAHPWAGLPVVVTLVVRDEAGQEGMSAPRGLILPERVFTKTLAKAIVDQRKSIVRNAAGIGTVLQNLDAISTSAEDEGLPPAILLGLRSVYWRLSKAPDKETLETAVEQLWNIAVQIEDGNLSAAERDLRAAQEKLRDAIERGAPSEEVQKAIAELRQALNRYVEVLQRQTGPSQTDASSKDGKSISPQELQKLLDKIEALAKTGSASAAEDMLTELQDILESLKAAKKGPENEENAAKSQQLDRMTKLTRQQQQLLDRTFQAEQQGGEGEGGTSQSGEEDGQEPGQDGGGKAGVPGQPRRGNPGKLRAQQEDIRKELQKLLSEMPGEKGKGDGIRKKMKESDAAMGEAGEALGAGELGPAGEQETRALENLRQGMRAMAEQMSGSSGGKSGGTQRTRDPMGRNQDGQSPDTGDGVKVPDEATMQRAREILDELHKRLGQPSRPPAELDYMERLIKRF